jgi:copper chaperone CopZ
MTHTYTVIGMTCSNCQAKIQDLFSKVPGVINVAVDLSKGEATIEMEKHIPIQDLKSTLKTYPQYSIEEKNGMHGMNMDKEETKSWFEIYKPILLIFGYIIAITVLVEFIDGSFDWMRWMRHFMGGFFLSFSFFKLLNLQGFAESYFSYDIIARKWFAWGYVYAFIELALGLAYLVNFNAALTNGITFAVMSVSIVGVLKSVLNKRKIKCACLGTVFNIPMSTVTIIEDALMIAMSLISLIILMQ